jgi:hypothetical protein
MAVVLAARTSTPRISRSFISRWMNSATTSA